MHGRVFMAALALSATAAAQGGISNAVEVREHGYVTNAVKLPATTTEAATLGRDLDGDRRRDNRLSRVFIALAGEGVDVAPALSDSIARGDTLMLHSLRTPSLANTKNATWQVWHAAPTADPDLTGTGTFALATDQPRSARLAATIKNERVQTAAGAVPVRLDIGSGAFDLRMKKAKLIAYCNRQGCGGGRLSGAVPAQQVEKRLIPAVSELLTTIVVQDCTGGGPESCMSGSTGQRLLALFDSNDDMTVSDDEVRDSDLLGSVLAPDLDLVKANGKPGQDGVNDAVTFGLGFTTVRAKLVRP